MKPIKIILSIFMIVVNYSAFAQYTILGKTSNLKDSSLVLLRNMDQDLPFDTALVINNTFKFHGNVQKCDQFFIRTEPYSRGNSRFIFVENTDITIDSRDRPLSKAIIHGGKLQEQSYQLDLFLDENKTFKEIQDQKSVFIMMHPDYEFCSYMITDMEINMSNHDIQTLFDALDKNVKNSRWGVSIKNYLEKSRDFNVGDKYVNFTLKDTNNNTVSLSSFNGKIFLLDFWGSWCGSCRIEHPGFVELYKKYKEKGFEIISVSLDGNLDKWLAAVKQDQLTWTNTCETSGFKSDIAVTYKTHSVPHNLLFDRDGKLIGKDLRSEALGKQLQMIFREE